MTRSPPALNKAHCLFLDIDGTLVEFTDTPSETHTDLDVRTLLTDLAAKLDGALALVSGRELRTIDALFGPLNLPAAGLHGVERRDAAGEIHGGSASDPKLNGARAALNQLVLSYPGTLIEDKGPNLAVHFRLAPHFADAVRRAVFAIAAPLIDSYQLQEGAQVIELKPRGFSKGSAVDAFMKEAPFKGRIPVFIGDDLTDMDGFAAVEKSGGVSIGVGDRVRAQYHLNGVREVRAYLRAFVTNSWVN
ncbi:MAG TPA: trehalose-phosphatase [Steroidobacteraceae bacterium]|jgi:trehalose 6-phosphate phosphatase